MRSPIISLLLMLSLSPPAHERTAGAGIVNEPDKTLRVVVFGGHPDDPESGAGGLIATLTRQGHEVICAYGTAFRGGRRFFDRPEAEVRREEATAACKVLGATPKFFPYAHEKLVADEATLKEVSDWLGEVRPDIVVTHWPLDTHPNHHVVSSLVWRCYQRQGGWNLYFFEVMTDQQSLAFRPELYLDIAPVREVKRRALMEHKSQEPGSIWAAHETMHRRRGAECGVEFAEAYCLVEAKGGARCCRSSSWVGKTPARRLRRGGSTAPLRSPRRSVTGTDSCPIPSSPSTRRGRRRSGSCSRTRSTGVVVTRSSTSCRSRPAGDTATATVFSKSGVTTSTTGSGDLRGPDLLASALVRRSPDRPSHSPGDLPPEGGAPLRRRPLPGEA